MQAFASTLKLEKEINELLVKLETDHSDEVLHALHDKQVAFEAADGYNLRPRAEDLLEGLGFSTAELTRPLDTFSGGWRMRVMLAQMMLQQPDLLLLDEPTNHLDLPSILWIEGYLKDYSGTVVIVSHDRYFLDKVVIKLQRSLHRRSLCIMVIIPSIWKRKVSVRSYSVHNSRIRRNILKSRKS